MWYPFLKFAGLNGLIDEAGLVPGVASRVIVAREKVGPPVVYGGELLVCRSAFEGLFTKCGKDTLLLLNG